MLVPNKYKNPSQNVFSVGKNIFEIAKTKELEVYNLYKKVVALRSEEFEINLPLFLFSLDFLYSLGVIELKGGVIKTI